jgi:hypothetical protein
MWPDYEPLVARIVLCLAVFEAERADSGHLRDVLAGFGPMEVPGVARQDDQAAGWMRLQFFGVEAIAQADIEDAGDDGIDAVLGMAMRHELHPDGTLTRIV